MIYNYITEIQLYNYKEEFKMLWIDYYFYLSKLPEKEKRNQILLIIGFFVVMFLIGLIDELIRHKFKKQK